MELGCKLIEKSISQSMFLSDNYSNKPFIKDGFSIAAAPSSSSSSSKGTNFLQDFCSFDQFNADGSSLNPLSKVQTCSTFDSFDAFPYGSSTNNVDFFDDYESKPFANNFQNDAFLMNISQSYNNPLDHTVGSRNYIKDHMALNFQEMKPVNLAVADEVSSVTVNDQKEAGVNKNNKQVFSSAKRTWRGRRKNNVIKGQWTVDEDRLLSQLVEQYGTKKWSRIAQMLPGRIGKQCRERWHNHLRPNIKKDVWSDEEDKILIEAHAEMGNKWAEIAKRLPGRTENSIKNHWNATKRRQYSKRKCKSKYPRESLLQDYIMSLNLDPSQQAPGRSNQLYAIGSSELDSRLKLSEPNLTLDDHQMLGFSFGDVTGFEFDEKIMFQDGYSFDSLLGEMICNDHHDQDVVDDNGFDMDESPLMMMMDFEVKKELDLAEMISQAKM